MTLHPETFESLLDEAPHSSLTAVEDDSTDDLGEEQEHSGVGDFQENLAETLTESNLTRLASDILEGIAHDQESRQEWEQTYTEGLKYLGFSLENQDDVSFAKACRAFDTTLSQALLRFSSRALSCGRTGGSADFRGKH